MSDTVIYGLFNPLQPEMIHYVGKGRLPDPAKNHWYGFINNGTATNGKLGRWFKRLSKQGIEPGWRALELIRTKDGEPDVEERENYWIAYWRELNPNLCNAAGYCSLVAFYRDTARRTASA